MDLTVDEIKRLLIDLMPPGFEAWADTSPDSDLDLLFESIAVSLDSDGFERVRRLVAEANPVTATDGSADGGNGGLDSWEAALNLAGTVYAQNGTEEQRRGQILARLREWGIPTQAHIKAALAAVCGYEPEILTHTRAQVTGTNEESIGTGGTIAPGVNTYTAVFADNAPASKAGAILRLEMSGGVTYSDLTLTLTAPSAASKSWTLTSDLYADGTTFYLWWPDAADEEITGTWTLDIDNAGAWTGDLDTAYLLVEGIGKDWGTGAQGFGAAMFEWSALIDPDLVATFTAFSPKGALEVVQRWRPAHTIGYLTFIMSGGGTCAVIDDPYALADACVIC